MHAKEVLLLETGESGSLMAVAVTVYGAKGNRSSWQASTGGNIAGSFRESLVNLTDRCQKWLGVLRGDKEKELGRTAGCNRTICLLRPWLRTKSQKTRYLQKSIFHIANILGRFPQADLPYHLSSPRRLGGIGEPMIAERRLEQNSPCNLAWGCSGQVCQRERVAQRRNPCDFATFYNQDCTEWETELDELSRLSPSTPSTLKPSPKCVSALFLISRDSYYSVHWGACSSVVTVSSF